MAYKVDYAELARVFNEKGEKGAHQYLKDVCGVNGIYKPMKILKSKYTYDEEMRKLIIPEDLHPADEPFLSMEELCPGPVETSEPPLTDESASNTMIPASQMTVFNNLMNVMLMERLQEYSGYITIDHIQRVCHINKSRLLASGFNVHVF